MRRGARLRAQPVSGWRIADRRRFGAGLVLLAVLLNLLGNVIYAPKVEAAGFTRIDWVEICTAHGIQTVAVQAEEAPAAPSGGYCPACPLCPVHLGLATHFPVLIATLEVAPMLPAGWPGEGWSAGEQARAPSPSASQPVLSRAPPASA